jgi:putative redox protein
MPTITTSYRGDISFAADLSGHRLVIDVPASMGGKGRGPTPPELFVTSLGSCVAAYVAAYCQTAGLDSRDLSVDVSYAKAVDPTRLVDLSITVNLPHADCGQRQAIRRVAERCPVHETIATLSQVHFEIRDRAALATA